MTGMSSMRRHDGPALRVLSLKPVAQRSASQITDKSFVRALWMPMSFLGFSWARYEYDANMPFKFSGTINKVEIKLGANQLSPDKRGELKQLQKDFAAIILGISEPNRDAP
jgi:hypothetical protein